MGKAPRLAFEEPEELELVAGRVWFLVRVAGRLVGYGSTWPAAWAVARRELEGGARVRVRAWSGGNRGG